MSEEIKEKDTVKREYVALTDESVQKINHWFEQISTKGKIHVSRKALVNWLIERLPENFSNSEMNMLTERFYDHEQYLRRLLREVRNAKTNGEIENFEVIVRSKKQENIGTEV